MEVVPQGQLVLRLVDAQAGTGVDPVLADRQVHAPVAVDLHRNGPALDQHLYAQLRRQGLSRIDRDQGELTAEDVVVVHLLHHQRDPGAILVRKFTRRLGGVGGGGGQQQRQRGRRKQDRKSTRLNSSH